MKKSFLHICLSESWGGLEMAVLRWNQILSENGHSNLNICTPDSPLGHNLKENAFPLIEWDSAHYFSPDFTWKLNKLLKQKHFDAVILQSLRDLWIVTPGFWGVKKTKLIGFAQMLLGIKKTDYLHRKVYSRLNYLLTLTDWQQKALQPYLPVHPKKYQTIPNFVDTMQFTPALRSEEMRYQFGFQPEHFVIGCIGRIDEQKGQWELLQAFRNIKDQFGSAHLAIVGEPTHGEKRQVDYFYKLKKFVADQKLDKRVHFIGFQKYPEKIMANFDLFVLPSYKETFGYVVVEAMASGTPVLATDAGGVTEILDKGKLGFLCRPMDVEDTTKYLKMAIENKEEREQKSILALHRVRDFYDRQKVYERFIDLI